LEQATANLKKAELDDTVSQEQRIKARDDAEAARVAAAAAIESVRIVAQAGTDAAEIARKGREDAQALDDTSAAEAAKASADSAQMVSDAKDTAASDVESAIKAAAAVDSQTAGIYTGIAEGYVSMTDFQRRSLEPRILVSHQGRTRVYPVPKSVLLGSSSRA